MALQASGPISASDISKEFGPTKNISFGAYRVSKTPTGTDLTLPLDAGIPGPGQPISFSDFYSKRLNIVVKCARTDEIKTRVTARNQYNDNDDLSVIGGFKGRPERTGGKKVWIHTNGTIGSNKSNVDSNKLERTHCSLIVGEWENNTTLKVDVGDKGIITGSGGGGGKGGRANVGDNRRGKNAENGKDGFNGTSALGISHVNNAIVISNRGRIQEGGGGGGGGGAAWNENRRRNERDVIFGSGGSGGGGGRGYPEGPGGEGGSGIKSGTSGKKGKLKTSGDGGVGVKDNNRTAGGGGGGGGAPDGDHGDGGAGDASGGTGQVGDGGHGGKGGNGGAFGGTDGRTANPDMKGGLGGLNGFALVVNGNGSNVSITGNGLLGNQINNTKPQ